MVSLDIKKSYLKYFVLVVVVLGVGVAIAGLGAEPDPGHPVSELQACADGEILKSVAGVWTCVLGGEGGTMDPRIGEFQTGACSDCLTTANSNDNWCRTESGEINCKYAAPSGGSGGSCSTCTYADSAGTCTNCGGSGGSGLWESSGSNIYRAVGNVGIGTSFPAAKLDVSGGIKASGSVDASNFNADWNSGAISGSNALFNNAVTAGQFCIGSDCRSSWPAGGGDNLGNHVMTQRLQTNGYRISNDGDDEGIFVYPDGSTRFSNTLVVSSGKIKTGHPSSSDCSGQDICSTEDIAADGYISVGRLLSGGVLDICKSSNGGRLATCGSSRRYKKQITDLNLGLKTVEELRSVTFKWKESGEKDLGFVAEEVEDVDPLLVVYKDGQVEGVKYKQLTAVLVNAIKEQQEEIEVLKEEICNLNPNSEVCD